MYVILKTVVKGKEGVRMGVSVSFKREAPNFVCLSRVLWFFKTLQSLNYRLLELNLEVEFISVKKFTQREPENSGFVFIFFFLDFSN